MTAPKKIRVLIVDDHFMARMGLAAPINGAPDLTVVAEAANAAEALAAYREHLPDVVTMDYRLPGADGVAATRQLRAEFPGARVLMLSAREGEEDVFRAVEAGVCGYLTKAASREALLDALRRIRAGLTAFPDDIAAKIAARRSRPTLTERELAVLTHVVQGRTNKEIGALMHMSGGLVKLLVSTVLEKLGAVDRTRAATLAIERGIVHLDEP